MVSATAQEFRRVAYVYQTQGREAAKALGSKYFNDVDSLTNAARNAEAFGYVARRPATTTIRDLPPRTTGITVTDVGREDTARTGFVVRERGKIREAVIRRREAEKPERTTIRDLPPEKRESIRAIDVGTEEEERIGAIVERGERRTITGERLRQRLIQEQQRRQEISPQQQEQQIRQAIEQQRQEELSRNTTETSNRISPILSGESKRFEPFIVNLSGFVRQGGVGEILTREEAARRGIPEEQLQPVTVDEFEEDAEYKRSLELTENILGLKKGEGTELLLQRQFELGGEEFEKAQKEEQKQKKLEAIRKRQQLPFKERVKIAFESAGEGSEFYGGIRAGLETLSVGLEKVGIDQITPSYLQFPVSPRPFEQAVTFGFFLAPTAPTTAQIERELFEVSRTKLVGVSQKVVGKKTIRTEAIFEVKRAGRTVRGFVSAKTQAARVEAQRVINLGRTKLFIGKKVGKDVLVTGARGKIGQRVYDVSPVSLRKIPSIRFLEKGRFGVQEISRVIPKGRGFIFKGGGKTIVSRKIIPFKSAGFGAKIKGKLVQAGATISREGRGVAFGILKTRTGLPKIKFRPLTTGQGRANLIQITKVQTQTQSLSLKQVARQATERAVSAAIKIPPETPLQPLSTGVGIVSAIQVQQPPQQSISFTYTPPREAIAQPQPQPTIPRTDVAQAPTISGRVSTREKIVSLQQQQQKQPQQERQVPQVIQQPIQTPAQQQKILTIQKQIQKQQAQQAIITIPILPPVPKPEEKFPIPPLIRGRSGRRGRGIFITEIRRRRKFFAIGRFGSINEAILAGRQATEFTLARSFRVTARGKPLTIKTPSGFRRGKKEPRVVIEKTARAINTPSEKIEIQTARKRSERRKKKKR